VLTSALARLRGEPNQFPVPQPGAVVAFERKNLVARLVELTGIGQE
jgi:hypothetical protein